MIFIQITQRAPVGDHIVQAVLKIIPLSRVDRYIHLISHKREWNNCFIKNAQKIYKIKLNKNARNVTSTLTIFIIQTKKKLCDD